MSTIRRAPASRNSTSTSVFDNAADTININDDDDVHVTVGQNGQLTISDVSGAVIHITGFEAGLDHLVIDGNPFAI